MWAENPFGFPSSRKYPSFAVVRHEQSQLVVDSSSLVFSLSLAGENENVSWKNERTKRTRERVTDRLSLNDIIPSRQWRRAANRRCMPFLCSLSVERVSQRREREKEKC